MKIVLNENEKEKFREVCKYLKEHIRVIEQTYLKEEQKTFNGM